MTYFDSATIEHLTYRVVAAKEYSDGSAGGGKVPAVLYAYVRIVVRDRRDGFSVLSRCHGLVSRGPPQYNTL